MFKMLCSWAGSWSFLLSLCRMDMLHARCTDNKTFIHCRLHKKQKLFITVFKNVATPWVNIGFLAGIWEYKVDFTVRPQATQSCPWTHHHPLRVCQLSISVESNESTSQSAALHFAILTPTKCLPLCLPWQSCQYRQMRHLHSVFAATVEDVDLLWDKIGFTRLMTFSSRRGENYSSQDRFYQTDRDLI